MNELNKDKILLQSVERNFHGTLHFVIYERSHNRNPHTIIAASYVGNPESAVAISAGIIEGRPVTLNGKEYGRNHDPYKRLERKIGLGDVVHSMVYNSAATIAGVFEGDKEDSDTYSYIIAPDGNVEKAVVDQIMSRFGLPPEWENQYFPMFKHLLTPLDVVSSQELNKMWPNIVGVRLNTSEAQVLKIVEAGLKSGFLTIPHSDVQGVFDPSWTMKEYMMNNNTAMARKLDEMKPRHTLEDKLDSSIATMSRTPFPAQAHMIQAIVNAFDEEESVFGSSDMGTGKSIQSIGVAHVLHERRKRNGAKKGTAVLLSAPGITLSKWKNKEILATLPHAKVQIIRNYKDVLKLYKKYRDGYRVPAGEIHFTLVGIDKAKMGPEPYYAGTWRRKNGAKDEYCWHCPDCGQPLKKKVDSTWIDLTWSSVAEGKAPEIDVIHEAMENKELLPNGLPKGYKVKWKSVRKHMKCCYRDDVNGYLPEGSKPCGTKMYRSAVKSRGETRNNPRVNISRILKRFNGLFDLYICDEVHKSKGAGSGRGDAFAAMVKAAKRNLLLTGTLVNGKSSSIKELLWRTDAKSLLEHGFSHQTGDVDWAKKYGKLEQVIKIAEEEKQGIVTRQSRRASQPVESPGIAPHMTAEFLLHKAGFLELGDMGLPLVELKEIPVFVNMDQEHASEYNHFHQKLYQKCAQLSAIGVKGAWSKFTPATIMYADRPDLGAFVKFDDETIAAPRIEGFHAKELKMVELVKKELAEDRGCVIYNNYTGQYRMNQRTKEVLAAHGIEAVILDEPNTDKRAEVIQKLEDEGRKVVITNMKLVEVGLDLLYWPTIINNQMSYEVSVFRQSNRRNWRIGQEKECRCYILVYDGSQQMSQFLSVMSGRGHAMLTEGRLDKSELAEFSRDGQSSLASDLAACFADSNVADAWTKLAAKDLESIETVAEADFKQVIAARMKALANETRRLCGVPVVGEHEPVEATAFPSSSHAQVSEVSIWGNLTGWENEDLFGTLTGWETLGNPFETEQLDMFVFEEALPVEFPPIKQEENTRTLFLVGA